MWLHSALMPAPCSVPGSSPLEQPSSTPSRWQRATRSHSILKDLLISNNPVTTAGRERDRQTDKDCAPCWAQRPMSRSKSLLTVNMSSKPDTILTKQTDFSLRTQKGRNASNSYVHLSTAVRVRNLHSISRCLLFSCSTAQRGMLPSFMRLKGSHFRALLFCKKHLETEEFSTKTLQRLYYEDKTDFDAKPLYEIPNYSVLVSALTW